MNATRTFPAEVVASLYSGYTLCNFGLVRELGDFLLDDLLVDTTFTMPYCINQMRGMLLAQFPRLAEFDAEGCNTSNWEQYRDAAIELLGETVEVRQKVHA